MLGGDKSVQFGTPVVSGAKVVAEVLSVPNTTDEDGNRVWGYRGEEGRHLPIQPSSPYTYWKWFPSKFNKT